VCRTPKHPSTITEGVRAKDLRGEGRAARERERIRSSLQCARRSSAPGRDDPTVQDVARRDPSGAARRARACSVERSWLAVRAGWEPRIPVPEGASPHLSVEQQHKVLARAIPKAAAGSGGAHALPFIPSRCSPTLAETGRGPSTRPFRERRSWVGPTQTDSGGKHGDGPANARDELEPWIALR
jgi:hypothetical protein